MSNYTVLATVNVTEYKSLDDLYQTLLSIKKEVFLDHERIIINYSTDQQLSLINELLIAIDIPVFFVQFEKVDSSDDSINFTFNESFCIYPWINLRISSLGRISPCCKFDSSKLTENINNTAIKDVYLGKTMSELRQAFRNGQKPVECTSCWKEEAAGLESMRQRAKYKFREIYHRLDYQSDNFNNLQLFDLNLGNACNLSCRICDHKSSSTIADLDHLHKRIDNQYYIELKQAANWSESTWFWEQLLSTAPNLKYLDLYGGEPLMSKNHFNFLKKLIELDIAKNIQIDYNSNGTIYSEKFFSLWEHFKSIKISFSIDDIGDRFEYQRNGASWSQVNDNIKKYVTHVNDKFTVDIFPTINVQNVYYLPELITWAQDTGLPISFSILHNPAFMSIASIPTHARLQIIEKLQPFAHHNVISAVITILEQSENADTNAFIEYMTTLDVERNQKFQHSHKEIAELIGYGQ